MSQRNKTLIYFLLFIGIGTWALTLLLPATVPTTPRPTIFSYALHENEFIDFTDGSRIIVDKIDGNNVGIWVSTFQEPTMGTRSPE